MKYAREHEKELLYRSIRRRMEIPQAPRPAPEQARTTEGPRRPRDTRCHLLRPQERLSLAVVAPRLPALGDRLLVVRKMAHGRHLRAAQRRFARAGAEPLRQEPAP
jgi:hypothetical protein